MDVGIARLRRQTLLRSPQTVPRLAREWARHIVDRHKDLDGSPLLAAVLYGEELDAHLLEVFERAPSPDVFSSRKLDIRLDQFPGDSAYRISGVLRILPMGWEEFVRVADFLAPEILSGPARCTILIDRLGRVNAILKEAVSRLARLGGDGKPRHPRRT